MADKKNDSKNMTTSFTMWLPMWMKEDLQALSNKTGTPMAQLAVAALKEKYFADSK